MNLIDIWIGGMCLSIIFCMALFTWGDGGSPVDIVEDNFTWRLMFFIVVWPASVAFVIFMLVGGGIGHLLRKIF